MIPGPATDACVADDDRSIGVPDGVLARAASLLALADRTMAERRPSACRAAELLTAPRRLEPDWPRPAEPIPVGRGWVHADIIDQDRAILDGLLQDRPWEPEPLSVAAQELRLAVSPYRSLPPTSGALPSLQPRHGHRPPTGAAEAVAGAVIVDLSTHWAGPLATKLLAEAGARVVKIDPDCRPDGFRTRPGLYQHLNGKKDVADLDLRRPDDRARFDSLIGEADLVIESFSRRVMTNLGYGPEDLRSIQPSICTLSVRAYPDGTAESDWVGYGPGVHATSGLAMAVGAPRPAAVAYPDLLTGLEGHLAGLCLLADPRRPAAREVSLLGSLQPLVDAATRRSARSRTGPGSESADV